MTTKSISSDLSLVTIKILLISDSKLSLQQVKNYSKIIT